MNQHYLLDSWAILTLLNKENPAAARVEELLRLASDGQIQLTLSVINLGELLYIFGRKHSPSAADKLLSYLKQLPIHILSANEDRVLAAARFKMTHTISYAHAFAAASAIELQAILVTGDPELLSLAQELELEALKREA